MMNVHLPQAENLDPAKIRPGQPLLVSNDILNDRQALDRRYEDEGYLFFRGILDRASVERARRRMAAPLVAQGLAVEEGEQLRWVGGERPSLAEDAPEFAGVVQELISDPRNQESLERILGEPAC